MTAPSAWRPLSEAPKDRAIFVKCKGMRFVSPANDDFRCSHEGALFVPMVADTLELDRAVQKAVAEAFGELICRLVDEADCANFRHWGALAAFRDILHTSMGGRIPDEVP